jgi:DNA polymerase-4
VKSVGHDQTFARSLEGVDAVLEAMKVHAAVVARALRGQSRVARTFTVIVRFDDRTSLSRSQTLAFGLDDEVGIAAIAGALVQSMELHNSVRLLALHASSFLERSRNAMQLTFAIDTATPDTRTRAVEVGRERQVGHEALRDAVDEIRRRFGRTSVGTASELREDGVTIVTQRGSHAFGPEQTP